MVSARLAMLTTNSAMFEVRQESTPREMFV